MVEAWLSLVLEIFQGEDKSAILRGFEPHIRATINLNIFD
jgi:hypothetical protein